MPTATPRASRRMVVALVSLTVLAGLLGMHALSSPMPAGMSMGMGDYAPSAHAGPGTTAGSLSGALNGLAGCESGHDACVAVLRVADQLPVPTIAMQAVVGASQPPPAQQCRSGASRAPPQGAGLLELCVSRT